MIRVLHVVRDDKFFDGVIKIFESDNRLSNRSILIVPNDNYQFRFIKSIDKLELLWSKKQINKCFTLNNYDVVFFHSLTCSDWKLIRLIPKDKIIIWWAWGFDLYNSFYGMKPLIELDLLKEKTNILYEKVNSSLNYKSKTIIKNLFLKRYFEYKRKQILKRIDYFQPVLNIEYKLMQKHSSFRAKEFYYLNSLPFSSDIICNRLINGNILFGNSASYTNNHLDAWEYIKNSNIKDRKIIIPLNYGDMSYANEIKKQIKSTENTILFLDTFIPSNEYFKLIKDCSYAIYGIMRQQAMGNIYYCLNNGIKLFLYKESLVYKYLKDEGFFVFKIEDIDEYSFHTPLSKEEIQTNISISNADTKRRNDIYESLIQEQMNKI
ncbi:MAG: TDP-N-acetylfucosamine:lipid II N-acetylfucosaminyltransferase [Bacteroidales bacterium]